MDDEDAAAIWGSETEYSASATVVPFDPPLPLLRRPVPAGPADDPSSGPFLLAFRDAVAWRSALRTTESKIIEQCEAGSRVGCSISASNQCRPPWWKYLFGMTAADYKERQECEEGEMAICLAAAKEACIQFAKDKCLHPFRDARIASDGIEGTQRFFWSRKESSGNAAPGKTKESESSCLHQETSHHLVATNYKGRDLMDKAAAEDIS